jgi:RNA polymerase sigma-70 factor, ECF subfamily
MPPELTQPEASVSDSRQHIVSMMEASYAVLLRLVRRKLNDQELAADLVNEAVAICLEHLRTGKLVKVDQGIAGYVFKVSMNLLRNYLRNKNNVAAARADSSVLESLAIPQQRDDSDDLRLKQLTREMLQSLNIPRDRAIIERFYLDEEDKDSICRDLGVTSTQFNLVVSRARQRMRRLLETRGLGKHDLLSLAVVLSSPGALLLLQSARSCGGSIVSWLGVGC